MPPNSTQIVRYLMSLLVSFLATLVLLWTLYQLDPQPESRRVWLLHEFETTILPIGLLVGLLAIASSHLSFRNHYVKLVGTVFGCALILLGVVIPQIDHLFDLKSVFAMCALDFHLHADECDGYWSVAKTILLVWGTNNIVSNVLVALALHCFIIVFGLATGRIPRAVRN